MLSAQEIKQAAISYGADIVGIGPIERWADGPAEQDPRWIMPTVRSIICIGFRMHHGSLRAVEAGNYYSVYTLAEFSDINNRVAPMVQRRLSNLIEDNGYDAVPVMFSSNRLTALQGQTAQENGQKKPRPDIFFNHRIGGVLCGVGQIGLSRLLLTPEFGPAQRLFFILTDAPLEADPILTEPICDGCLECVRHCPGKALQKGTSDDVEVPNVVTIKRMKLDAIKCAIVHGTGALSPFASDEVKAYARNIIDGTETCLADGSPRPDDETIRKELDGKVSYAANAQKWFQSPAGLCAGAGCIRACLAHLEKRGRLKRSYHHPLNVSGNG